MTFLDEYRASGVPGPTQDRRLEVVREWLTSRPEALFEDLRRHAPTMRIGNMAFVTRYRDVLDVLGRNDVFSVSPYGEAMMRINRGPNFLLGMDDGPEYRQQAGLLSRAFTREDAARVGATVDAHTATVLDAASAHGRLDVAEGFGRLVPALFIADYFGVPGPDRATLARWARAIFTDAFVNVLNLAPLSQRAMRSSKAFRGYLDGLITQARSERASGVARDDVLGRMLAQQDAGGRELSDAWIRDTLLWCVAGMIDNVNTAVCRVVDLVLADRALMSDAVAAARADDAPRMRAIVSESLRFHTPTPIVTRRSVRPHILSRGTAYETTIPAGTLTFVGAGAAMMDETAIDAPQTFRLGRPPEQYLHFGAGLHQCLGLHVAMAHVTGMVAGLLERPGLRRASGPAGRLRMIGPFPARLVVQMDVR